MTLLSKHMRSRCLATIIAFLGTVLLASPALAQEDQEEDEGPGERYATITSFDVPYQDREQVLPYIQEHVVPLQRLNPHLVTFRVLAHNSGSNADEIIFYSEYENFADIRGDCGQPCEEYREEHPIPEEGDEGYEEYSDARRLYQKYFSDHDDEIYMVPMQAAKTEGENIGTVGPSENENQDNDGNDDQ